MVGWNDRVTRSDQVLFARTGAEVVALDVAGGAVFGFNDTAAWIWEMIETPKSVGEICAALIEAYAVDEETCRREVGVLVETLASEGLLTIAS